MSEPDPLFLVRNHFYAGGYQTAINEAAGLTLTNEGLKVERDVYVYRSYLAQGNAGLVLDEIKSEDISLQAIKQLAIWVSAEAARDDVLATLLAWMEDPVKSTAPTLRLVTAICHYQAEDYENCLKVLHGLPTLEAHALSIQAYLKLNRADSAAKQHTAMAKLDDDAPLTQLAGAWIAQAMGGAKLQEAMYAYQELMDRYSPTVTLLNGVAATQIAMGKYPDAEQSLMAALEKKPNDPETLINLTSLFHLSGRSDRAARFTSQLKVAAPNHRHVLASSALESAFERAAARFAPSTTS